MIRSIRFEIIKEKCIFKSVKKFSRDFRDESKKCLELSKEQSNTGWIEMICWLFSKKILALAIRYDWNKCNKGFNRKLYHVIRRLKVKKKFCRIQPGSWEVILITVGLSWAWNWTNVGSIGLTWSKENDRNSADFELKWNQAPVSIFDLFHSIAKWCEQKMSIVL